MRILFLTETIPAPLDSGGRIKTFHTLEVLARRHEIHCHSFIRQESQRRHAAMLAGVCRELTLHLTPRSVWREAGHLARALASSRPFTLVRHFQPSVHDTILGDTNRRSFDLVYCDHLSMVQYADVLDLPLLYDAHNVEWALIDRHRSVQNGLLRRRAGAWEADVLRQVEAAALGRADLTLAVSDADARGLALLEPAAHVRVVPISVDVRNAPVHPRPSTPEILFVGGLHWPPNALAAEWLTREIWPLVHRARPDARLLCVGRASDAERRRLEETPGVAAVGGVDDIEPWFRRGRALVVPLRSGSGMRVKILDALARGLPVVATSLGWEGIEAVPGRHLLSADDAATLADHLLRCLDDDALIARLAAAGRALVLERYDVEAISTDLLRAIDETVERHDARKLCRAD